MLVLSRKKSEAIVIRVAGETIRILLLDTRGDRARLGFNAGLHVEIDREEVFNAKEREREADRG